MVSRRVLLGGWSAAAVAASVASVASVALLRGGSGTVRTSVSAPPASATGDGARAAEVTTPAVPSIDEPATVSTPADRLDTPLRVDWVGGSDVAWEAVSLPNAVVERVPRFEGRPIDMRTSIRKAVMAGGVEEMVGDAIAAGADALIVSINPVWLHWDEVSCALDDQHERYACLLTPLSAAVSTRRADELGALVVTAAGAGVPVYMYTQPHSTDVLANADVAPRIEAAEAAIAAYDPGLPHVRFVSRIFTRDMAPMREGVDFIDVVHPTIAGAGSLADWLAADILAFWRSVALGR